MLSGPQESTLHENISSFQSSATIAESPWIERLIQLILSILFPTLFNPRLRRIPPSKYLRPQSVLVELKERIASSNQPGSSRISWFSDIRIQGKAR